MVLKGAFGAQLLENRSDESFNCEKSLDGKNIHYQSPLFFLTVKQQQTSLGLFL